MLSYRRRDTIGDMAVVVVCLALLVVGILAIIRWGSLDWRPPPVPDGADAHRPAIVVRRYLWMLSILMWTTVITAILIVGPAARLAMRLLAATAGAAAQGKETEAGEIVGRITVGGTIGIFVFVGVFGAVLSVFAFLCLRNWLPRGRLGGLVLGAFLLIVAGSRIEPLRAENVDFDVVGPGWLAIVVFFAMALVQGMAVQAVAVRVSRSLPLPGKRLREIVPHAPLLLLIPGFAIGVFAIIGGVIAVLVTLALSRMRASQILSSKRVLLAGRLIVAVVTVVALPGFVMAVIDIAGRGP